MLTYDPYFNEDEELKRQILECMGELGYEVEEPEEEADKKVTVH